MSSVSSEEGLNHLRPEILAPAGDFERLDAAVRYGADAVYIAGKRFGMRSAPDNFDRAGISAAVRTAHDAGVRIYLTCNILPHDEAMRSLPEEMEFWQDVGIDALIIADMGVLSLAKKHAPRCAVHMSTQTGVVNYHAARVLHDMGVSRIVLARELSMNEIAELRIKAPAELEIECFVHGAMCMGFSGRCMLSAYLSGRNANLGDCTQPCRWSYDLIEKKRPGIAYNVSEDKDGTYFFNANDLNMIEHVAALSYAGVSSFKIEGRAKAAYYAAVTSNAYRCAVDAFAGSGFKKDWKPEQWMVEELDKISHRPYGTGFYFGQPHQNTREGGYIREYTVAAVAEEIRDGRLMLTQRNRFERGDVLDVLIPGGPPLLIKAEDMRDAEGNPIDAAPHAMMELSIRCSAEAAKRITPGNYLRIRA